tara:strand:+ start:453 stop:626 length:174 start_codon:yes stop_codon:yes gene_type:complete
MKVGDLVRIRVSFSRKAIGKLAIVVKKNPWGAMIFIMDTGEREEYDVRKLEVINGSR